MVVCLTALPDVIAARLAAQPGERPLAAQWQALLATRQPYYDVLPYQVDTSDKTPQQVAEEIIALWRTLFQ
jgi:chloramphenicol 3-O-phosphotransferase